MPHSDTVAVHAGEPAIDRKDAPITPDISVGSASGYPDLESLDAAMAEHRGYGRWGTENHRQLEGAAGGAPAGARARCGAGGGGVGGRRERGGGGAGGRGWPTNLKKGGVRLVR